MMPPSQIDAKLIESGVPKTLRDMVARGFVHEKMGEWEDAFPLYSQALMQMPLNPFIQQSVRRAGVALHRKNESGRSRERQTYVQQAQRRMDRDYLVLDELETRCEEGFTLLRRRRVLEASDVFNRVLDKSPAYPPALQGVKKIQEVLARRLRQGRFATSQYYSATAGVYQYNEGNWEKAAEFLEKASKAGPWPPDLSEARLPDYAVEARARRERQRWETEREKLLAQAVVFMNDAQFEKAEPLLKAILDRDPSDGDADYRYRVVRERLLFAEENRKREFMEQEVRREMAEGARLYAGAQYTEAMETFVRVLDLDSENAAAQESLKKSQAGMKKQGLFVPEIPVADKAEKLYREGLRFYGNEEYEKALEAVQGALRLNPNHLEARTVLEKLTEDAPTKP
jgi:tetratricopeptide (TPR) repeat protein